MPDPAEYASALRGSFDALLADARKVNHELAKPGPKNPAA
jgi:hypothetical protein